MDTGTIRDISREQFEQWAKDRYSWHLHDDARDPEDRTLASWDGEIYGNRIVEGMWQAWQASRAAVVVELPPKWNDATHSNKQAWDCGIDDARMAIEAQGLKCEVKP